MKNLKKTLCLLLAVLMTVSLLAGCGKKVDDNADSKKVFTVGIVAEYPPFSYLGDDGSYTGFVGYNSGTLRNIVLTTDVPYLTDESGKLLSAPPTAAVSGVIQRRTVYAGVLAGRNSTGGSIANCAVSGYVLQNYTYSGSMLYMGGLVGYNEGTIRGSSAVTR